MSSFVLRLGEMADGDVAENAMEVATCLKNSKSFNSCELAPNDLMCEQTNQDGIIKSANELKCAKHQIDSGVGNGSRLDTALSDTFVSSEKLRDSSQYKRMERAVYSTMSNCPLRQSQLTVPKKTIVPNNALEHADLSRRKYDECSPFSHYRNRDTFECVDQFKSFDFLNESSGYPFRHVSSTC